MVYRMIRKHKKSQKIYGIKCEYRNFQLKNSQKTSKNSQNKFFSDILREKLHSASKIIKDTLKKFRIPFPGSKVGFKPFQIH